MLRTISIAILCITLVFSTSGNSRGLIFKNLAKDLHSLKTDLNAPTPAAEEIFEQVNEKKVPIAILVNPLIKVKENELMRLAPSDEWLRNNLFRKIQLPPPRK